MIQCRTFWLCLPPRNMKIKTYGCILLFIDLCGCKTGSFTLREKYRLRMSENGVLRKLFEQKRKNITAGWRTLLWFWGVLTPKEPSLSLFLWDSLFASSHEACPAWVLMNFYFLFLGVSALVGRCLPYEVRRSHSDTPHSVGLVWTSHRPVAETSTWQNTTLTRDKHPRPRRGSNMQSQQAVNSRHTPCVARPLG
jgi:hypothetical protein